MKVRIKSNRQVEFPQEALDALGANPGDQLELVKTDSGYLLRNHSLDVSKLAPLSHLVKPDTPPFDIHKFRESGYGASVRV